MTQIILLQVSLSQIQEVNNHLLHLTNHNHLLNQDLMDHSLHLLSLTKAMIQSQFNTLRVMMEIFIILLQESQCLELQQ